LSESTSHSITLYCTVLSIYRSHSSLFNYNLSCQ
jgi:hypothetical protein